MTMNIPQTQRTTIRRLPKRGVYDRELVYGILDEGFISPCQLRCRWPALRYTHGVRAGPRSAYIHGSQVSRLRARCRKGLTLCVGITLVDGLVLARSAFIIP